MPYAIRGGYVVNTETGEKKNKTPLPLKKLKRYLRTLQAIEHGWTKPKKSG
ncbi:MAG TPA: hypothetical protein VIV12_17155 [Streptosporangiaceae bacterium]